MKKWSKVISIVLLVVLVSASLFGCAGNKDTSSPTATPAGEGEKATEKPQEKPADIVLQPDQFKGKKVTIWQSYPDGDAAQGARRRSLVEGIEEFNKLSGAQVEKIIMADDPDYIKKVVTSIAAGTGPDIVVVQPFDVPAWIFRKFLLPISDYVDLTQDFLYGEQGLSKPTIERFTWNGKVYGVNGLEQSWRLYYNTEIFEANGQPDPAELYKKGQWTWDKFIEVAQALTLDTDGDGKMDIYGFSAFGADKAAIYSNGGSWTIFENGKPVFAPDRPEVIEAIKFFKDFIPKYKIMPEQFWDPNPMTMFYDGKLAMMYWGAWEMNTMVQKMAGKFKIAPFPVGPNNKTGKSRDIGQASGLGITTSSKNPDVAATYLAWSFVTDPEQAKIARELAIKNYGTEDQYNLAIEITKNAYLEWDWPTLGDVIGKINGADAASVAQVAAEQKAAGQAIIDKTLSGEIFKEIEEKEKAEAEKKE